MARSSQTAPTIDPEAESIMAAAMKAKAKPKQRPRSLDVERRMKADPRDPRTHVHQWPCFNKHTPAPPQANQHGQWVSCQCCNLRLLYTPRKGSPASTMATVHPSTVKRMLNELRTHLGEVRPTATICHHAMNKVTADIVLQRSVRELLTGHLPTTTSYPTSPTPGGTTSATTASWDVAQEDDELIQAYENENHDQF